MYITLGYSSSLHVSIINHFVYSCSTFLVVEYLGGKQHNKYSLQVSGSMRRLHTPTILHIFMWRLNDQQRILGKQHRETEFYSSISAVPWRKHQHERHKRNTKKGPVACRNKSGNSIHSLQFLAGYIFQFEIYTTISSKSIRCATTTFIFILRKTTPTETLFPFLSRHPFIRQALRSRLYTK